MTFFLCSFYLVFFERKFKKLKFCSPGVKFLMSKLCISDHVHWSLCLWIINIYSIKKRKDKIVPLLLMKCWLHLHKGRRSISTNSSSPQCSNSRSFGNRLFLHFTQRTQICLQQQIIFSK